MLIQQQISDLVTAALQVAIDQKLLPNVHASDIPLERPQNIDHGDFASSIPMKLASSMSMNPYEIAETLSSLIEKKETLDEVWAARPGYINFSLKKSWLAAQVDLILDNSETFGNVNIGNGKRIQIEFVSINPTGPLHIGHIRGAVLGSALANILKSAGYQVEREYYLNDAGSQMDRFNESLYVRYLQHFNRESEIPEDGYKGEYMVDLAKGIREEHGDRFLNIDKKQAITDLGTVGLEKMIGLIRKDLRLIHVEFDSWFSEQSLFKNGQYTTTMELLHQKGYLKDRDGATWFTTTKLGDIDDKVMVRSTGEPAYFATDVAYHHDKFFNRKFDWVIDVLGADHQGHVLFMKAVTKALGLPKDRLTIILNQLVSLKRGGESIRVSKRSGEMITMRELVQEIGSDACRYLFLSRSADSQMEFDLDLIKDQSPDNPIYYSQYAHARVAGILRLAIQKNIEFSEGDVSLLTHESELSLIRKLLFLPELIEQIATNLEPQHLPHYSNELASAFHKFYDQCRVVSNLPAEANLSKARLKLCKATKIVLARCLHLMMMDAPKTM